MVVYENFLVVPWIGNSDSNFFLTDDHHKTILDQSELSALAG